MRKKLEAAFPFSALKGGANVLIFPNLEASNIACRLLTSIGGAETLGPILTGMAKPVHLLARGVEVEEIVNITTIAVVDAQDVAFTPTARAQQKPRQRWVCSSQMLVQYLGASPTARPFSFLITLARDPRPCRFHGKS